MDLSNTKKKWDVKGKTTIAYNLSFGSITNMILKGAIKEDDLVWHAGMSGWRKVGEQEDLKPIFSRHSRRIRPRRKTEVSQWK
jgi:hypothetical protein